MKRTKSHTKAGRLALSSETLRRLTTLDDAELANAMGGLKPTKSQIIPTPPPDCGACP
jgi:hypothetical protein